MTAAEMKVAFLIRHDVIASNIAPGYEDEEISYFLSEAEIEVALDAAAKYEENEVIRKLLSNMLVTDFNLTASSFTNANDVPNSTWYSVPKTVLKIVRERFIASSSDVCIEGKELKVVPVRQDDVSSNLNRNPFHTPNDEKVWRLDTWDSANGKLHQIITADNYTPKEYGYLYIKFPTGINTNSSTTKNSDMDPGLHDDIVEKAVRFATSATRQQEYKVALSEEKLNTILK